MKSFLSLALATLLLISCSTGQTTSASSLPAKAFAEKVKQLPGAPVLDVRTPGEFSGGHLEGALNYDWNGSQFEKQVSTLDKSKPVFVYCLSGGRSSAAASHLRENGFKEVYELQGGIMQWRSEGLPETTALQAKTRQLNLESFRELLQSDQTVLVDFYADWCAPCKRMEPYLKEISKELQSTVSVVRINADENPDLCRELEISSIPVLQVYKAGKLTWTNNGFIEKAAVLEHLK